MRAVDTNVLLRLVTQDDPKQAAAAEVFIGPGAWISHLVLVETLWVLASVFGRPPRVIATCVAMLLEHESLVIQDSDTVRAALDQFLARPTLGFSDCLILEIARKAGHSPLGTFDRAFSKLSGVQKI